MCTRRQFRRCVLIACFQWFLLFSIEQSVLAISASSSLCRVSPWLSLR